MDDSRRGFLKSALAAAGVAVSPAAGGAQGTAGTHSGSGQLVPSDLTLRVKSLESLLLEKGLVDRAALDALIDTFEHKVGPRNGARVVARAWLDSAYKKRLMTHADEAIAELGFERAQGEHMVVVENTPAVHNVVVCTLCSCYPWTLLGISTVTLQRAGGQQ